MVVNNTGPASIPADIASLKFGDGRIALVGFFWKGWEQIGILLC